MDNSNDISITLRILACQGKCTAKSAATMCHTSEMHVQNTWQKAEIVKIRQAKRKRNIND